MAKLLGGTTIAGDLLVTGNVYMSTPASGDNSTKAATTAFLTNYTVLKSQSGAFASTGNLALTGSNLRTQINALSGSAVLGNGSITGMMSITQAQYNVLTPSAAMVYLIVG
jgi:hypothetical protein